MIDSTATDTDLLAVINEIKVHRPQDPEAAATLSQILAFSGARIIPRGHVSADVASTGGPSSLSTLICPLFLRAAGASVPKLGVSGRPAGGIDCLVQIPGYRSLMSQTEIERTLDDTGYVHFLGGEVITPLDTRMFRIRQQNSEQEVPTLVTASLMAKKLAVGVKFAGLDIRVAPHGNFGKNWDTASLNARLFIEVGHLLEIHATPVLTDGRFPYQPYIGRKEALLALQQIFSGKSSPWLREHLYLCRTLALACIPPPMRSRVANTSASELETVFRNNVIAQGGDLGALDSMLQSLEHEHREAVSADEEGFAFFDLQSIRKALVEWQNLRTEPDQPFPDPVGIILAKRPGEWTRKGEILATVRIQGLPKEHVLNNLKNLVICVTSVPLSTQARGIEP